MTTGSIEQRLDRMEEHLTRHSECLEEITKSIEAVNIGIQGNREHDQPGYKQRILTLERDVAELNDLKKKIQYKVSVIAVMLSFVVNAIPFIIQLLK
jgi:uncharacterized protein Yka (UPF0111/DUF47 family)